jgi:hypothetical protein
VPRVSKFIFQAIKGTYYFVFCVFALVAFWVKISRESELKPSQKWVTAYGKQQPSIVIQGSLHVVAVLVGIGCVTNEFISLGEMLFLVVLMVNFTPAFPHNLRSSSGLALQCTSLTSSDTSLKRVFRMIKKILSYDNCQADLDAGRAGIFKSGSMRWKEGA